LVALGDGARRRLPRARMSPMRRLRLVSLVCAAIVLVALGLFLRRAMQSAEAERAARHRAIADRALDEMERELTRWLQAEENRAYGQYRFLLVGAAPCPARPRPPLSQPPADPFVVGYFQIEPDGSVT